MENNYFAQTDMVIRKNVKQVFKAFTNPEITQHFWFTDSTGKLEEGTSVIWTWQMYNLQIPVTVKQVIPNKKLIITWGSPENQSTVEWTFNALTEEATQVIIRNHGFIGKEEEIIKQLRDSTGGFTFVLSGLKAYLEHGINLNLIADKFPKELRS